MTLDKNTRVVTNTLRLVISGLLITVSMLSAPPSYAGGRVAGPEQTSSGIKTANVSLSNAKRAAQNYLSVMGFSRKGLIDQLVFEGYSRSIATKAVDSLRVNWNKQAGRVAQNYIDVMPFSRQGLIDQLMFDGFSRSQATAGVKAVGY